MMNNLKFSNRFIFMLVFLFVMSLTIGCAKDVPPPEVEPEPAAAEVEAPSEPEPEPEAAPEAGFGIEESTEDASGGFIAESGEAVAEEAVAEEPVAEEPVAEEPVFEEPVFEEPVFEEPVAEEPVFEEPVAEEPEVVEEPEPEPEPTIVTMPEPEPAAEPEPEEEVRLLPLAPTFDLQDINFAYDKFDLDEEAKSTLRDNADWLKQNPNVKVEIEGHCDERGTNNYNLALGERRARSTKKYLQALGVSKSRLFTISYGEERPQCFDSDEFCYGQNRRAHFIAAE